MAMTEPEGIISSGEPEDPISISSLLELRARASLPGDRSWVKRRVEQMEILDRRAVRWQVSIDFIVPADAPAIELGDATYHLIPITTLRKGDLVSFDLRAGSGSAMWLPTSEDGSAWLAPSLAGMALDVLADTPAPHGFDEQIHRIISEGPHAHRDAYEPFMVAIENINAADELRALEQDSATGNPCDLFTQIGDMMALHRAQSRDRSDCRV
jgi:hypothetical protein